MSGAPARLPLRATRAARPRTLGVAVALLLAASPAAAFPEAAAPSLRLDVVAAGHTPDPVPPHGQWSGFLTMTRDSNVTAASYQICRVGAACFAPPAPAWRDGDTFRFDTSNYTVRGQPVDYQPGWRIGVQWFLTEGRDAEARTVAFPEGTPLDDPSCAGDAALACQESHYLAFDMPAEARQAPGPAALLVAFLPIVLAIVLRRRAHG